MWVFANLLSLPQAGDRKAMIHESVTFKAASIMEPTSFFLFDILLIVE